MRLPRQVNICGKIFKVVANPDHDGGSADTDKMLIEVGTKDPAEVAENLIHELGEAVMMVRDFRFATEKDEKENSDYRFFLDHKDWQLFAKDLSVALRGIKFDK